MPSKKPAPTTIPLKPFPKPSPSKPSQPHLPPSNESSESLSSLRAVHHIDPPKPSALHIDQTPTSPTNSKLHDREVQRKLRDVLVRNNVMTNTVSAHFDKQRQDKAKRAGYVPSDTPEEDDTTYAISVFQEHLCGNKARLMRDLEEVRVVSHGESEVEIIMTSRSGDVYRTFRSSTQLIDPCKIVPTHSYQPTCRFDPNPLKQFIDETHENLAVYDKACLCLKAVLSGAGSQVLLGADGIPHHILRTLSNLADASDRLLKDATDLATVVKAVMERVETEVEEHSGVRDGPFGPVWENYDQVKGRLRNVLVRVERLEGAIAKEMVARADALIQRASNILSIDEAFKSRKLAGSMKRLSWITFIFLPLLFVASLYGMNVDILADNVAPWWTALTFGLCTAIITFSTVYIWKFRRPLHLLLLRLRTRLLRLLPLRNRRTNWILDEEATSAALSSPLSSSLVAMAMTFQAIRSGNEATALAILTRTDTRSLAHAVLATPGDNAPFPHLLLAVRQPQLPLPTFLKLCNLPPTAQDPRYGWTLLHHAVYSGNVAAVKSVLRDFPDLAVDTRDVGGRTPLHLAFLGGSMESVELLLRSGAEPGELDWEGRVPMDYVGRGTEGLEGFPRGLAFSTTIVQ